MGIFDFADKHPWWTLLYLVIICACLTEGLKRLIKITVNNNQKHGYNVDTGPVSMVEPWKKEF